MKLERKPTQQDVTWFLDLHSSGKLDLEPSYQRKSVWNRSDREFYLDTIINNFPCPPIFLHKDMDPDGKVTYRVIDGKQRLSTIIDFSKDKVAFGKNPEQATSYDDKRFSELLEDQKRTFWNYMLPVEMVNADSVDIIRSIFDRLNRNNKKLNDQELRKAKYGGEFQAFVETESEDTSYWGTLVKFTKRDISRMADHQYIAELAILVTAGKIQGFSQDAIDSFYAENDETFESGAVVKEKFTKMKELLLSINHSQGGVVAVTGREFLYHLQC